MSRAPRIPLLASLLLAPCLAIRAQDSRLPDPVRLQRHVRHLAEACVPRDWQHSEGLDKAAQYLREALAACGADVSEQAYVVKGKTYRNILARFGPSQGARVVVGAHYDAYGLFSGADDNASGVAGLLELARKLQQNPPAGPVELVAYTLEEPPFFRTPDMGSVRHARSLREAQVRLKAMLSLDMIGGFDPKSAAQRRWSISVVGHEPSAPLVKKVRRAMGAVPGLEVKTLVAPRSRSGVDWSDHHPYWDLGYPAVMINDCTHREDDAYHTAKDIPDRLDYEGLAKVVEGVHAAVKELLKR